MNLIFGILGALSLLYYILLVAYAGVGSTFSFFWIILTLLFGLLFFFFRFRGTKELFQRLPLWIRVPILTTLGLGAALFLFVEGRIVLAMILKSNVSYDYLIIPGAHVNGTEPSKSLRSRLDKTVEYLTENPDTRVIVSGGQGEGEEISEASAMRIYLVSAGIDRSRIYMERYATDTVENLRYSRALIGEENPKIGIVTSDYHVFRAVSIGKKMGIRQIGGIAARTDAIYLPNMMMREFFAVLKEWFMGNI